MEHTLKERGTHRVRSKTEMPSREGPKAVLVGAVGVGFGEQGGARRSSRACWPCSSGLTDQGTVLSIWTEAGYSFSTRCFDMLWLISLGSLRCVYAGRLRVFVIV